MTSPFPLHDEEREKRQAETEAEVAARFDGTIRLIASIRCFGTGSGKQRKRCVKHIHLYPAEPGEAISHKQASDFARQRGWKQRRRDGIPVWICPACLDCPDAR